MLQSETFPWLQRERNSRETLELKCHEHDGVSLCKLILTYSLSLFFHSLDLALGLSSWAPPACLNSLRVVHVRRSTCDPLLFHTPSFSFLYVLCSCWFSLFLCLFKVHFCCHSFFPFLSFSTSLSFNVIHISIPSVFLQALTHCFYRYDQRNTSYTDEKWPLLLLWHQQVYLWTL